MTGYLLFLAVGAFIISALVNKFLLVFLDRRGMLDIPNERSSHVRPTPRGGGLGIIIGAVLCSTVYAIVTDDPKIFLLVFISLVIGMVGWVDDIKKGLSAGFRIGIQFICSVVVIWIFKPIDILPLPAPLHIHLHFFGIIISVIWLVGITNIFNFLDGIDGYAGVQGFIAGLMLAILAWGTPIGFIGLFASLSCAGFLLFNWHPAKIFMGDVGSSFLGFLFAALPFYLTDTGTSSLRTEMFFATAIAIWFFLLDGTFTIFRRLYKKEKIWQAHRSHLYQRLVITGMSHSEVVITVCFFYSVLFAVTIFFGIQPSANIIRWPVLIIGFILFFIYLAYTLMREKKVITAGKKNNL